VNPQPDTGISEHWFLMSVPKVEDLQKPPPLHTLHRPHSKSGSVSLGTLVQAPTEPATLQALQVPPQGALQQTPSVQNELRHWLPPPQF
jgi:hypothetical protein